MKFLFHVTRGRSWNELSHDDCLAYARELVRLHGGVASEVRLIPRSNHGEPDPPYVTRLLAERAVVVETTLEALARWAGDSDCVVQLLASRLWDDSDVGPLEYRIIISDGDNDPAGQGGDDACGA